MLCSENKNDEKFYRLKLLQSYTEIYEIDSKNDKELKKKV